MKTKSSIFTACLLAALAGPGAVALAQAPAKAPSAETLSHGSFKNLTLYRPPGEAKSFVLFLSGEGGWTPALAAQAQALAAQSGARMAVIAENVANADTPGYKAKELPAFAEVYGDDPMGGGATTAGAAGDAAFERDV